MGLATEVEHDAEIEGFIARCEAAFSHLFKAAQTKDEVQFALSLFAELRGCGEHGWSTAEEARVAFKQYLELLQELPNDKPVTARIALSFYANLSEAADLYEIPKNLLRVVDGHGFLMWPFADLVRQHKLTGERIAPGASKVISDLIGHADSLGFNDLVLVIKETFDFDLRNGYAHADYSLIPEGIRLPKRNGGQSRLVTYEEFGKRLTKSINLFKTLHKIIGDSMRSYAVPKTVRGRLSSNDIEGDITISWDSERRHFTIGSGRP